LKKIAIVGAGLSGASLAYLLKDHYQITVFEKARGLGGRLSVRYSEQFEFDFGAPYFQALDPHFIEFLKEHAAADFVDDKMVFLPKMNSLVKHLLKDIPLELQTQITRVSYEDNLWHLHGENGFLGSFDSLFLAIPPQQADNLLGGSIALEPYFLKPCFVLMLGLNTPYAKKVLKLNHPIIERIVANHLKPGRNHQSSLVVYTHANWSLEHLESELPHLEDMLVDEVLSQLELQKESASYQQLHRWRYALSDKEHSLGFIYNDSLQLGLIGDAYLKGDVESAYLSALALSKHLNQTL
jgi:predicted NAD/FAD-dependent oxidoreductase